MDNKTQEEYQARLTKDKYLSKFIKLSDKQLEEIAKGEGNLFFQVLKIVFEAEYELMKEEIFNTQPNQYNKDRDFNHAQMYGERALMKRLLELPKQAEALIELRKAEAEKQNKGA